MDKIDRGNLELNGIEMDCRPAGVEDCNFETGMGRLEEIARTLEVRDLPLEKALELFQEGVELIGRCRGILDKTERTVNAILEERDGTHRLVPLSEEQFTR